MHYVQLNVVKWRFLWRGMKKFRAAFFNCPSPPSFTPLWSFHIRNRTTNCMLLEFSSCYALSLLYFKQERWRIDCESIRPISHWTTFTIVFLDESFLPNMAKKAGIEPRTACHHFKSSWIGPSILSSLQGDDVLGIDKHQLHQGPTRVIAPPFTGRMDYILTIWQCRTARPNHRIHTFNHAETRGHREFMLPFGNPCLVFARAKTTDVGFCSESSATPEPAVENHHLEDRTLKNPSFQAKRSSLWRLTQGSGIYKSQPQIFFDVRRLE